MEDIGACPWQMRLTINVIFFNIRYSSHVCTFLKLKKISVLYYKKVSINVTQNGVFMTYASFGMSYRPV